jgi:hypothetical protein
LHERWQPPGPIWSPAHAAILQLEMASDHGAIACEKRANSTERLDTLGADSNLC